MPMLEAQVPIPFLSLWQVYFLKPSSSYLILPFKYNYCIAEIIEQKKLQNTQTITKHYLKSSDSHGTCIPKTLQGYQYLCTGSDQE